MSNLLDGVTRHQIFVQRYAAGREREAVAFIERMIKTVNSRLASDITDFSRGRLESILFDLEQYAKETLASYSEKTVEEALKFAQYEIGFNERLLGQNISASLTLPAPNQVSAGIFSSVMNVEPKRGYTIEQALKAFEGKKSSQIVDTIRSGVILGDTRQQITSALVRMGDLQKQQAATLTRTITNHVSTEARSLFMEENEDVLEGYEWVATLDSRTSLVCSSRDGTVYPFTNDPIRSPKPPAHFSCRSTIVPKVKDEFDLTGGRVGVRPAIGADGVEQVRGSTDYQSWLTRQPKAFQVEVLGKERAELFRKGDLKLTNFVDSAGETISLNRLRELEPLAFQKAGVELPVIVPRSVTVAPVVQQVRPEQVLSSALSTNKFVTKDTLNSIYQSIDTPEIAKLQEFIREKEIKTVIINQSQMSIKTKASRDIFPQVFNYLETNKNSLLRDRLDAGRITNNLYATTRASSVNGFTSSTYNHVVVKNKVTKQFENFSEIATNMQKLVEDYVKLPAENKPWSFSDGMGRIYKSDAGAMATTLLHELGHQVHYYAGAPQMPQFLKEVRLTKYSTTNNAEFHAEHFAAWAINREALAGKSQKLAEYFDDLMEKALKSNFRSSEGL
jgi:SPP1 gp7 family putative phage head morphogenesis protein